MFSIYKHNNETYLLVLQLLAWRPAWLDIAFGSEVAQMLCTKISQCLSSERYAPIISMALPEAQGHPLTEQPRPLLSNSS